MQWDVDRLYDALDPLDTIGIVVESGFPPRSRNSPVIDNLGPGCYHKAASNRKRYFRRSLCGGQRYGKPSLPVQRPS